VKCKKIAFNNLPQLISDLRKGNFAHFVELLITFKKYIPWVKVLTSSCQVESCVVEFKMCYFETMGQQMGKIRMTLNNAESGNFDAE